MSWSDGTTKHMGTRDIIAAENDRWMKDDRIADQDTSDKYPMIRLSLIGVAGR